MQLHTEVGSQICDLGLVYSNESQMVDQDIWR